MNPDGFQGDERDVILYSLSFDNDVMPRAALSARQANQDHIQGMLNVGFTRARDEIHIFHSAPIADFTLADGTSGAIAEWLEHCQKVQEEGHIARRERRLGRSDSDFESNVCQALLKNGYNVTQQYPSCGFYIDVVIERDGLRLAVECDGELWHHDEHGELKREDVERQAVLERAGWEVLRVPYRAWTENPAAQLDRIDAWFESQLYGSDAVDEAEDSEDVREQHYVRADQAAVLRQLQQGVTDAEQLIKEARAALGYSRTGHKIRRQLEATMDSLERSGLIVVEEGECFLTPKGRSIDPQGWSPPSRTYAPSGTSRRPAQTSHSAADRTTHYPIVCSKCGTNSTVPFSPRPGRPVYCRACYYKGHRR